MDFLESSRAQLLPLTHQVVESLDAATQAAETHFFVQILLHLHEMQEDMDLMNLFLELSTTAFQTFSFSKSQLQLIDELLATAENIALTLSAQTSDAH